MPGEKDRLREELLRKKEIGLDDLRNSQPDQILKDTKFKRLSE